tara:strand:- start:111 stop:467 length:357 start_codon:yes stop_codon:yes gene_type:complete
MGNKPNMKPGTNELRRRSEYLLNEINRLHNFFEYVHRLVTEYINYKGDETEFKKHLEEILNANKEEGGELRKGSGTNRSTGNNKQATNKRQEKTVKSSNSTKKSTSIKDTSESGNIGL